MNARFILYTDGSATARTLNGGAGMVVTEGDLANPSTLLTKQQRGAVFTSSYDEEKAVLEWLLPSHAATAICTDSQSLLKAIRSGSADTTDRRRMFNKRAGKTTYSGSQATAGLLAMRRRMPVLRKRQQLPMVLPDQSPTP